jgi:molecular chaperone HscC
LALAERAKRGLSNDMQVVLEADLQGHKIATTITRDRFDDLTGQLMARLSGPLDRALNDAKMQPEKIGKAVLVGGATRMAAVRTFASRKLRQFPMMGLDPDHVVILGAAVQAALVAEDAALDDVVMTDVSAFTLGVETAHHIGQNYREGYFAPLIERNSIIPTSRERNFAVVALGQQELRFGIYQGESLLVMNNLFLGEVRVKVPRNMERHESATVRFTYDVPGLLEVDITVDSTGKKAHLVIDQLAGEMSDSDIKSALGKMAKLKVHPRDEAANLHLRTRLEAAYAMARADGRYWVSRMLFDFDAAIDAQDKQVLGKMRKAIHEAIDAFEANHVT